MRTLSTSPAGIHSPAIHAGFIRIIQFLSWNLEKFRSPALKCRLSFAWNLNTYLYKSAALIDYAVFFSIQIFFWHLLYQIIVADLLSTECLLTIVMNVFFLSKYEPFCRYNNDMALYLVNTQILLQLPIETIKSRWLGISGCTGQGKWRQENKDVYLNMLVWIYL